MGCCSWKCSLLAILLTIGVAFMLFGFFAFVFVPKFVQKMVKEQTYLGRDEKGGDNVALKMFRDPPYDIKLQVWTFSVQNAEMVVKQGEKPVVIEKGPYTFNVVLHKTNVSFAANDTRLFFRNGRTYFFNSSQSCYNCHLTDPVIVPNIIFQKIVDAFMNMNKAIRMIIEPIIKGRESVFLNVSVDQLLFAGYEDKLISEFCNNWLVKRFHVCERLKIPNRIGLFYGQNGTDDGLYEVNTGLHDVEELDKVYSWNGMEGKVANKYWYNETARMINGTDAELYTPNLYSIDQLQIFVGQLCRSFDLVKRGTSITSDIPVFRYGQPDSLLDVDVQRSQGFCNPNSPDYFHNKSIQEAGCAPSGLLDMSTCLPGQPRIFWSAAHFRNAPPGVHLEGMRAPSDDDISYFDIEPITGVVVGVQQKSQLNLGLLRGNMGMTKKMLNLIVPIIWINESAIIDAATKAQIRIPVEAVYYAFTGGLGLVVAGALFTVIFVGIFIGLKIAKGRHNAGPMDEANPYTPLIAAEQPTATDFQQSTPNAPMANAPPPFD